MKFLLDEITSKVCFIFLFLLVIFSNSAFVFGGVIQIGFEGMSGAGKTSTLVFLAQKIVKGCLCLPEINIEEGFSEVQTSDVWKEYHDLWHERIGILKKIQGNLLIFTDRTYFTNLAFTYAFFGGAYSEEYKIQKSSIEKDFERDVFDAIFFFDVSPELGLRRRNRQGDFPPYPWSNISFLEKMREFYYEELPKLYKGKIIYISTDAINKIQLLELISTDIFRRFSSKIEYGVNYNSSEEEKRLLDYGLKFEDLGPPYSQGFYVMGFPTIYFRQFALQLDGKNVFILNNDRLRRILGDKRIE